MAAQKSAAAPRNGATRLNPKVRKLQILEEASGFFADHGFQAGTPDLARRMGISQPLMYRYFPTKEKLLRDVYRHVFPVNNSWLEWERLLGDTSMPLRLRLVRFFEEYAEITWNYRVMRLLLWAGLSRPDLSRHYTAALHGRIFPAIVRAVRVECGRPAAAPIREDELEIVQALHGTMYHLLGIRRWIHTRRFKGDVRKAIALRVDLFLDGAADMFSSAAVPTRSLGRSPGRSLGRSVGRNAAKDARLPA
jgi:AcrR family transcriptional regulator